MKVKQLRTIAKTLNATVSDGRRITALISGIRNYSDTVATGSEKEAIAKLKLSITLAIAYSADRGFISQLKAQVKALKALIKVEVTSVTFDGFKPPYTYSTGTIVHRSRTHKFLCYMNAPSLANEARAIDPTFDKSVDPAIKAELREIVKAALIETWNRYRFAIICQAA
jgi:hypothetical protein